MSIQDSFKLRVAKLKDITLNISVENTIPILITKDNKITDYIFKTSTETTKGSTDNTIADAEYKTETTKDRFIFFTALKSPLTNNVVYVYYDRKYQDIIMLPPIDYYNLGLPTMTYNIRASRLGGGEELPNYFWHQDVPISDNSRYFLPETKANVASKTHLISLPGMATVSNNNHDDGYEEMINDSINLRHNTRRLGILVEIGLPRDVFVTPSSIPLYLLHQYSAMEYGIQYISNINQSANKLYFRLRF